MTPEEAIAIIENYIEVVTLQQYSRPFPKMRKAINSVAATANERSAVEADKMAEEFDGYDAKDTATAFRSLAKKLRKLAKEKP